LTYQSRDLLPNSNSVKSSKMAAEHMVCLYTQSYIPLKF